MIGVTNQIIPGDASSPSVEDAASDALPSPWSIGGRQTGPGVANPRPHSVAAWSAYGVGVVVGPAIADRFVGENWDQR